jgi:hypothetical protein
VRGGLGMHPNEASRVPRSVDLNPLRRTA